MKAIHLFLMLMLVTFSCSRQPISGSDFLEERYRYRKINVINISDQVRFAPESGALIIEEESQELNKLLEFLSRNGNSEVEIRVSHIYDSEQYYEEGFLKSINLRNFFISRGIAPSRIKATTFLDKRSKYPYNSEFRKVFLVVTNIKPK